MNVRLWFEENKLLDARHSDDLVFEWLRRRDLEHARIMVKLVVEVAQGA